MLFDSPLNVIISMIKKYTGETNSKVARMENTIATLGVKLDTMCDSLHRLTVMVNQLAESNQTDTKDSGDDTVIVFGH
jgi:hypothetical protein